jgi:hypothetical protein
MTLQLLSWGGAYFFAPGILTQSYLLLPTMMLPNPRKHFALSFLSQHMLLRDPSLQHWEYKMNKTVLVFVCLGSFGD